MQKCDELLNPRSCLNKSQPTEPVFVLCARDPKAPQAIRHWVTMSAYDQPGEKLSEALSLANDMECWYKENVANVVEEKCANPFENKGQAIHSPGLAGVIPGRNLR